MMVAMTGWRGFLRLALLTGWILPVACSSQDQSAEFAARSTTTSKPGASTSAGTQQSEAAEVRSSSATDPPPSLSVTLKSVLSVDTTDVGYMNVQALRDVGWLAAIRANKDLAGSLKELETKCGADPLAAVDEIASANSPVGFVAIFKLGAHRDVALECVKHVAGGDLINDVAGRPVVQLTPDQAVTLDGDFLILGSKKSIEAVRSRTSSAPPRFALVLTPRAGVILNVALASPDLPYDLTRVQLLLTTTTEELLIELTGEARNEDGTKRFEAWVGQATAEAAQLKGVPADFQKLVKELKTSRQGNVVTVKLGIKGDQTKQSEALGLLTQALVIGGRRYTTSAKTSEAKNNIGAIARALASHVQSCQDQSATPNTCLFPASAPAVPTAIPKGLKYQSAISDWTGPWNQMKFILSEPQYYRYRTETSRDGKTCTVIAEGDLDGDGKTSFFSTTVTIDAKGATKITRDIKMQDELE